ncbi:MAG TPA: dockerin type I domain-containing protein [Pseudobacteroides sp.]|uniref:dockerin type I domain-containing protein n=1 Tax=Pseudobacteroides sp. TaxID=1968840 RepID=UPI002F934205
MIKLKKVIPAAYMLLITSQFLHPIQLPIHTQSNTVYSLNGTITPATTQQSSTTATPSLTLASTATPANATIFTPASTTTPTSTQTPTPTQTPTNSIPVTQSSFPTVQPTNTPENHNVIIEGWFKGNKNEDRQEFKIDVYEGYNQTPIFKSYTNPNGYFKLGFNTNTKYILKVYKPDSKYLPRVYKLSLTGSLRIGSLSTPEVMYWGDLNNDEVVNMADFVLQTAHFNLTSSNPQFNPDSDMNSDGVVNTADVIQLGKLFNVLPESLGKKIYLEGDAKTCYDPSGWYSIEDTELNLNGHKLNVYGSLSFRSTTLANSAGSTLNINGGTLDISGDLNFGQPGYYDSLVMKKEEGRLIIGRGFIFATAIDHEGILTAGTLVIKGDYFNVNDESNNKAFYASGNHKILLSGPGRKVIKLASDDPKRNRRANIIQVPHNSQFEIWPSNAYNCIVYLSGE